MVWNVFIQSLHITIYGGFFMAVTIKEVAALAGVYRPQFPEPVKITLLSVKRQKNACAKPCFS